MITYFYWWYFEEPRVLWRAINVISFKIFENFSIGLLLRTLFEPWKRDTLSVENASLEIQIRVLLENLVSRLVGAILRIITIVVGLFATTISFAGLFIGFLCWFLMPVIIIWLLASGVGELING